MKLITQTNNIHNIPIDFLCDALVIPRATYYRHQDDKGKDASQKTASPKNALSDAERQVVLDLLHSERFIDKTPYRNVSGELRQISY